MYFNSKKSKWIAKVLLFVFFVEPVLFAIPVKQTQAQNTASSNYNQAFGSYDGISQWGNAALTSSPAIGNALKSCLNVVPTFTKKIKRLFSSKTSGSSAVGSLSSNNNTSNSGPQQICLSSTPEQKWISGYTWGEGVPDGYITGDDIKQCEEAVNEATGAADAAKSLQYAADVVDTKDQQAISELQRIRRAEEVTQQKLDENNRQSAETNKKLDENQVRDNCMDSIAYSMTKTLLAGITEGTVNLINTGNFGDPFFIKDTKNYFEDIKKTSLKQVFGGLIEELNAANQAQYPYLKSTYINLVAQNVPVEFRDRTRFTLEQALSGQPYNRANDPGVFSTPQASGQGSLVNMFKNDFSVGGWRGWLALTQQPQNNPIGFGLLAQEELERKQTAAAEQAKSELQQSGGFLSMRKCVEQREPVTTQGLGVERIATGEYRIRTRGITAKPDDPDCVKSEVVTPGSVLASRLDAVITSDVHQLELADQFNESLNLIFTAAFNKLTSEGLSALSSQVYGSWAAQTSKQSFIERYNNAVNQSVNTNTSSTIGTAELIYRRAQSSYSSYDFDITTDLFDQQVGCQVRPGILTIEKRYLQELKNSNNKNLSPIYKLMPAMAELDFCIPGPTTNWEEMADEKFDDLFTGIAEGGIAFVANSDVPGSTYDQIGKQKGDIELKRQRNENAASLTSTGLKAAGGVVAAIPAPPFTQIIGAALVLTGFVVDLVHYLSSKKKKANEQKIIDVLNRAESVLRNMISDVFGKEAFDWGNRQLEYLKTDYSDYKQAVYEKFSDKNTIAVAAVARPFVEDLPSYAKNLLTIQEGYDEEFKTQQQIVEQVQIIADKVKVIKDAATARVRAEEKAKGLPEGSLTDVPKECKPNTNQCPAQPTGGSYLLGANLANYAAALPAGNAASAQFINAALVDDGTVRFPDPEAKLNVFIQKDSNGTYSVSITADTSPTTLSVILYDPFDASSGSSIYVPGGQVLSIGKEIYGLGGLDLPPHTGLSLSAVLGKTVTIKATNPNKKSINYSCTVRVAPNTIVGSGILACL